MGIPLPYSPFGSQWKQIINKGFLNCVPNLKCHMPLDTQGLHQAGGEQFFSLTNN